MAYRAVLNLAGDNLFINRSTPQRSSNKSILERIMSINWIHLLILLFSFVSCDSDSPVGPKKVGHLPEGNTYTAIEFVNAENGWVVGDSGLIYTTTNSGNNWSKQDIATADNLYKIDFVDESHGWVASDWRVWHTIDGGDVWYEQLVDSSLSEFVSIAFFDQNTGWISGSPEGTIYHTSNGGDSWSDVSIADPGRIIDLSFVSHEIGWGLGASTRLYKTSNGGISWVEIERPRWLHCISFVDSLIGYAGDATYLSAEMNSSKIFKTIDGGITWTAQAVPPTQLVSSLTYIDSENGFATFIHGKVHYTTDGGENWNEVLNLPKSLNYIDIAVLNVSDAYILSASGEVFRILK